MKLRTINHLALVATGALVLTNCGPRVTSADKTGTDAIVLRLATIDGDVNGNGQLFGPQAFVDSLDEVSGGRLRIELTTVYGDGAADAESKLVEAIASGELDGGWPSTRAFAAAGIDGLAAVEAPMTITSYDAQKALVSGPVAPMILEQLDGSGVLGLGLTVGPLRRPFAADAPLLSPDDWAGATFRVFNSPVQSDAIRALGGEPVNLGFEWFDEVVAGNLRGAEFDVAQYASNGHGTEAGHVAANVVLWPKVFVLSVNEERFDSLTDEQDEWVREAADRAVQASVDASYDESTLATQLCEVGVRFVESSPDQLTSLRASLAPVIDGLAADELDGPILAEIQAIASQHPEPETIDVPAPCGSATSAASGDEFEVPEEVSALPDGVYRVEITLDDVEAAGVSNGSGFTGTWTLTIADGTYQVTCRAIDDPGRDCGNSTFEGALEAGYVRGSGNVVYFVYDAEVHSELTGCGLPCFPLDTYRVTWALDGDVLTFTDSAPFIAYEKVLEPYVRIG